MVSFRVTGICVITEDVYMRSSKKQKENKKRRASKEKSEVGSVLITGYRISTEK